jgi:hypothetical protein
MSNIQDKNVISFIHSGCGGDFISSLSTVKLMTEKYGKKARIILDATGGTQVNDQQTNEVIRVTTVGKGLNFSKSECEFIFPLVKAQDYVEDVIIYDGSNKENVFNYDYNLNKMRLIFNDKNAVEKTNRNLEYLYKFQLGLQTVDSGPWLQCEKIEIPKKICVVRSTRYQSAHPWIKAHQPILEKNSIFIGTELEHKVFQNAFEFIPEYVKIENALDAAKILNSSDLVIANGTLFYWIAVGLGCKNIINELCNDVLTTYYQDKDNISYISGLRQFKKINFG